MNKEWSNTFKEVSSLIGKKNTFSDGINKLIEFRLELFKQIEYVVNNYPSDAFYKMPYMNVDGYHNKSIAYSIWHIFRIEDIVAHELIAKDKQVLFTNNYLELTNSPIITTGNELVKEEIGEFSKKLSIKELYIIQRL